MRAAAIVTLAFLLADYTSARPGIRGRGPSSPGGRGSADQLSPSEVESLLKRKEERKLTWAPYDFLEKGLRTAPWVKDPFFPEGNGFKLLGVISSESAFINGKWYRRGETVEGFVVKEINPNGVTLTRRSEIVVLKLDQ